MHTLFSLPSPVTLTDGGYSLPAFSSTADRIRITAAGRSGSAGETASPISVVILSHGKSEPPHTVYSGEISPDESGAFTFAYSFDPVHLAVYRNAESYTVSFAAAEAVLTHLTAEEETDPVAKDRAAVLRAHPIREVSGVPSVPVLALDGSVTDVPALPQNVLMIGNSLLLGLFLQYGMCASSPRHDYACLVTEQLKMRNPGLTVRKLYGSPFECLTDAADFEKWYSVDENPYTKKPAGASFTEDLDLILIQLSDNVNTDEKKAAFPETADRLLARIKADSPRARVVWIYGWYNKPLTEEAILALTEKWKIECIDISPLRDKEAEATKGQLMETPDGTTAVTPDGFLTHPGNEGMRRIADAILTLLG